MKEFLLFVKHFCNLIWKTRGVVFFLLALIVLGAYIFHLVEHIKFGKALYFSFITALTVGYGDITPTTTIAQWISIALGFIGMIFFGLIVAISNLAVRRSVLHP